MFYDFRLIEEIGIYIYGHNILFLLPYSQGIICMSAQYIDLDSKLLALIHLIQMKTGKWFIKAVMLVTIFVKFGGICSFDSGFRNKSMILTLEKSQVFGTILFFSFATIHVCRPIFLYAKKIEIQVLD